MKVRLNLTLAQARLVRDVAETLGADDECETDEEQAELRRWRTVHREAKRTVERYEARRAGVLEPDQNTLNEKLSKGREALVRMTDLVNQVKYCVSIDDMLDVTPDQLDEDLQALTEAFGVLEIRAGEPT